MRLLIYIATAFLLFAISLHVTQPLLSESARKYAEVGFWMGYIFGMISLFVAVKRSTGKFFALSAQQTNFLIDISIFAAVLLLVLVIIEWLDTRGTGREWWKPVLAALLGWPLVTVVSRVILRRWRRSD